MPNTILKTMIKNKFLANGVLTRHDIIREWVDSRYEDLQEYIANELAVMIGMGIIPVPKDFDMFDTQLLADELANDFLA